MTGLAQVLSGEVTAAARGLLGRRLASRVGDELVIATIVEVEAYGGGDDPASHAVRGETPRNRSMFGPPGTLYVYRSYGVHWCVNVVTGSAGDPSAVLFRAALVVEGREIAARRRRRSDHLADGPGKLAQALGVTAVHDGTSVFDGPIRIDGEASEAVVVATPRVGISRAVDWPWRFTLGG